tara:strand:- start:3798 stop:4184 length:387 start_codon:yes stop_codon:yes gene_type:complete
MSKKILIADDAPYIREIIRNILSEENITFLPDACDGAEVVDLALKHQPDLIFMDLALPKKSGIDASAEILENLDHVRIVAISSLHDSYMIQAALEAGCVDFIKKPFQVEDILQAVNYSEKSEKVASGE